MPEPNEPFIPQLVDEQIEQITHELEQHYSPATPEAELIQNIHDLYRHYADARDRVRQRLYVHMADRHEKVMQGKASNFHFSIDIPQKQRKNRNMQYVQKSSAQSHFVKPRLVLIVASLLAAFLVIALAVVVPLVRSTNPPGTSQTGVQISQGGPAAIYIGNTQGVLKLDSRTGAILKNYPWPDKPPFTIGTVQPYALQMSGKWLYVGVNIINENGNLFYTAVQALDPTTGATRWIYYAPTDHPSTMTIASGLVYMSVDNPDTRQSASLIFALDASNGQTRTHYNVPETVKDITVTQGFLYAHSFGNLYGINLATKQTWKAQGPLGVDQGFTDFQVVNGILYASAYNGTGSYFVAFHPDTGKQSWHSRTIPGKIFNFIIAQNVIYFGTTEPLPGISGQPGCSCDGRFDAYDLGQHKLLWEQKAGSVARTYAVASGVVYAVIQFPYAGGPVDPELIALSTDHGKLLWHTNAGSQDYRFDPVVNGGHLFIAGGTVASQSGTLMYMLAPVDGTVIWKKTFPFALRIWAYIIVSAR